MLDNVILWIKDSFIHSMLSGNVFIFPTAETLHFMALTLLFGALLLIDLRGLGFFKAFSFESVHKLVPVVLIAFSVNLLTGLVFIFKGYPLSPTYVNM